MTAHLVATERSRIWRLPAPANAGAFWLGIALLGAVAFYWTGLGSLLVAWQRPEYSHGYLIAPIALYLLLNQMAREDGAAADRVVRRGAGVAVVLFGLALGLLGNLVQIADISTYGLILCVAGLVLTVWGTKRGVRFWAPVAYLIFMLPLPNFVYLPLSIRLQAISSEIGVALISLFGVPVYLDGNVIDLGTYKLQVAEACNGLRYLFPLASFGFLFAVLYRGPVWHKAVLFLSALPITVLMNCFRIAVIGLLVDRYGIDQAEGFLHFFEGWVIFVACIALLYLEAFLLQRFAGPGKPIHAMLRIAPAAVAGQIGRIGRLRPTGALVFVSAALLGAGLAWHAVPARTATAPERSPLILFPLELGDWRGERKILDATIERVLAADDYLVVNYETTDAAANLLVAYYKSQTSGSGIHSPEVCIPGGGWEISKWTIVDSGMAAPSGQTLNVNRAIIQKGLDRQLVYYWFEQRGRALTSDYAAKIYTVLDSVTRRRTDGALIRIITPIGATEAESAADDRLRGFLGLVLTELPRYVPR